MDRICPDCRTPLVREDIVGIELDVCPDCAGIWFDDGELLKLKELGDEEMAQVDDAFVPAEDAVRNPEVARRLCPICAVSMQEFSYLYTSAVRLDSCEKCFGTWVEHGELRSMGEALAASRQTEIDSGVRQQILLVRDEYVHKDFIDRHRTIARALKVITLRRSSPF